ncbi:MAG: fructose-6-phosphate aldolase [Candidatus Tectomicrobia bacterium]|uniref:Probable transaldolase n=1 Tax=Tectimicrobiota bacterium TaxID=2528274 RepID=A0A932I1X9_UNCTE|nr:fructose-6-phosphate aldolase [Candidatus Tectomicrobia bacterium]
MKIFIDTANLQEIKEAAATGVIDGVTTNPTLIAKEGADIHTRIREICEVVNGPVSAEVVATKWEEMVEEGRELAAIHDNVVVKVPIGLDGLKAVKKLREENISTNVTLIFNPAQALLAAKAGASFVSPFVGRLDDITSPGMDMAADIVRIFQNYDFATQVLVASVRHPMHVLEAARMGADVATCPFGVIGQLLKHPLTDIGLEKFLADWRRASELR